jgi:hypothetical protein
MKRQVRYVVGGGVEPEQTVFNGPRQGCEWMVIGRIKCGENGPYALQGEIPDVIIIQYVDIIIPRIDEAILDGV